MKRFLLIYLALLVVLIMILYSCGSSGSNGPDVTIAGTWNLVQEYSNEGEGTPLEEFPLSKCNKMTTLEIFDSGRFIEKSYYEDSSISGECAKDSEDTKGDWKKGPNGMFLFIYDKNNALFLKGSTVTVEKGNLVVTSVYTDGDLGSGTILKFMYSRVL